MAREWRTTMAAAGGQAPSRELAGLARGVDRETIREVRGYVRRGEAAPDPPRARLAVALARDQQRQLRLAGGGLRVVFGLLVLLWALQVGRQLAGGGLGLDGILYAGCAVGGLLVLFSVPRWSAAAIRAEAANRRLLEEAGEPYAPVASGVVEPRPRALAMAAVPLFVFNTVGFGLLSRLIDGEPVTVAGVLAEGLAFGILFTLFTVVWMRWRNRRAAGG